MDFSSVYYGGSNVLLLSTFLYSKVTPVIAISVLLVKAHILQNSSLIKLNVCVHRLLYIGQWNERKFSFILELCDLQCPFMLAVYLSICHCTL